MPARESRAGARRRVIRRRRQVAASGLLVFCTLVVMGGLRLAATLTNEPVVAAIIRSTTPVISPTPTTQAATAAPTAASTAAPTTHSPGTGEYERAPGGTLRHGSGTLKTYRVEVETGTGQDVQAFAAAVDATLANPASWAGGGRWSVQRVSSDDADLVIRLATSATVGKVCTAAGLEDAAYSSCRTGQLVMINLDRWLHAVPEYKGDVQLYRHYVINHEMGHGLGYGHQSCPAAGRLASVMQQQTLGLNGCLPNGWPYIAGVLVSGPTTA